MKNKYKFNFIENLISKKSLIKLAIGFVVLFINYYDNCINYSINH